MKKKFIFAVLGLSIASMASATTSSNLKLMPFNSGKVLGTVNLNHFGSTPGYFKIVFKFSKTDGHTTRSINSKTTGVYNKFFAKNYIVDEPNDSTMGNITSANASISIETCTDKTFNSCSIVKEQEITIDLNANTITSISPNKLDVTI